MAEKGLTKKEVLEIIIRDHGACEDTNLCGTVCHETCPIHRTCRKVLRLYHNHNNRISLIYDALYKTALKVYMETYGEAELLTILL